MLVKRNPLRKYFVRVKRYDNLIHTLDKKSRDLNLLRNELIDLKRGNEILKRQHESLLLIQDSQLKKDLQEAINIIIDYQKTLFRLQSPDPNVQRANDLLNKWNLKSERVHGKYKIFAEGKDITMGQEF